MSKVFGKRKNKNLKKVLIAGLKGEAPVLLASLKKTTKNLAIKIQSEDQIKVSENELYNSVQTTA